MPRQKEFGREAALDRAMSAFWTKGYAATSVEDLVAHMAIQRGSLYATFGDKRSLFLSALDHYQRVVTRELFEVLEAPGSGLEAIRRFFRLRVEAALDRSRPAGCLVTNSAVELSRRDRGASAKVRGSMIGLEAAFLRALERARARGGAGRRQGLASLGPLPDQQRPGPLGDGQGLPGASGARGCGRGRPDRARGRAAGAPSEAGAVIP